MLLFLLMVGTVSSLNIHADYGKKNIEVVFENGTNCIIDYTRPSPGLYEYFGNNSELTTTDTMKNTIIHHLKNTNDFGRLYESLNDKSGDLFTQCRHNLPLPTYTSLYRGSRVIDGISHLNLFKMNGSSFVGFKKDNFTTLPETPDRPIFLTLGLQWERKDQLSHKDVEASIVKTFHTTESNSAQEFIQKAFRELPIDRIKFKCNNNHYIKLSNSSIIPLHGAYGYFKGEMTKKPSHVIHVKSTHPNRPWGIKGDFVNDLKQN